MVYATATDFRNPAYGLPDEAADSLAPEGSTNVTDDANAIIDEGLEAASDLANSYLSSRYTLPLTAFGKALTRVVCHIAAYDLMVGRGYNPLNQDENLRLRYEDALRWLRDVARGVVTPSEIEDSTPEVDEGEPLHSGNVGLEFSF